MSKYVSNLYRLPATAEDYATEFLDLKISVKLVENVYEAIEHIQYFGTNHSEAIITEDQLTAETFLNNVDAAECIIMPPPASQTALNLAMVQKSVLVHKSYMPVDQWACLH